jgi:NADH pyrophosphatase NudC (nudix superfamily)
MQEPHTIVSRYENRDYLLKGFKAEVISGTINTELDVETNDARWFEISEIPKLKTPKPQNPKTPKPLLIE